MKLLPSQPLPCVLRLSCCSLSGLFGLILPLICGLSLTTSAMPQTLEHPNVLFIFLDDYGWRDCGFMGSDFYETPNIDRLASEGMVFTHAYATASNCAPSRACLLSGQYTPRHQIYNVGTRLRGDKRYSRLSHVPGTDTLRKDIRTWAQCVQSAGYVTGIIGKWHLSDNPLEYGFDSNIAGSHSGSPPQGYFPPHPGAPGLQGAAKDEYLTDRLNSEAIHFIDANKHQPWMLFLSHFAVHSPLQSKPESEANFRSKPAGKLHSSAVMAGMIQSVDQGIGRLVAKLHETGLTDKTAIVFTSDNGGSGQATSMLPLKGYKGTYYEGGLREPFFVAWPGVVAAQTTCETPISNVDLFPTFCEITGATLPEQVLDGVSLLPLLKQTGPIEDRALYWHFPAYLEGYTRTDQQRDEIFRSRPCSIIREGNWKLHQYFEDGGLELYNLGNDEGEQVDLSAAEPEKTQQLLAKLVAWQTETGAPIPRNPNPNFDAMAESIERARLSQVSQPGQNGVLSAGFIYPLENRQTPECHASTIVETPSGLVAAWFGGEHENNPDVGIWVSRREGQAWNRPVEVVNGSEGESQDFACWNPVLFQPKQGPLLLFYKVGLNPRMWWGALVTSDDDGRTWSKPSRLGTSESLFSENQSLLGPVKNKPMQLSDGALLCPSSTENEGWRIHFEISRDLGKSWEVVGPLQEGEQLDAIQPSILTHADGRLQIVCRTKQGVIGTSWSSDTGRTWGPMQSLALPNPNSGTDAVTLSDGRQLLVYNHTQRTNKQDGRQVLNVAISSDGQNWSRVLTLENHGDPAGYSYPAVIQSSDGLVHITYTWRRKTIKHVILDPSKLSAN